MHPFPNGYWDWPNVQRKKKTLNQLGEEEEEKDEAIVSAKYVFLGPCTPSDPTEAGFRFEKDTEANRKYRVIKNNLRSLLLN